MSVHTPKLRLAVIGNGMVGQRFLEALINEAPARFAVDVVCEEPRLAYDRVHLSEFFCGKNAADLALAEEGFFRQHGIGVRVADAAVSIDRAHRRIVTAQGVQLDYDKLVMATGSFPFVPQLPGRDRPHCFVYRTIEDLEGIRAAGSQSGPHPALIKLTASATVIC